MPTFSVPSQDFDCGTCRECAPQAIGAVWQIACPRCRSVSSHLSVVVGALTRHEPLPFVHAVLACERAVREAGLDAPPWHELTEEVQVEVDSESEPNQSCRGWQKKAAGTVDNKFFSEEFWPALSGQERALIRSQTGPCQPCRSLSCAGRFSRFDPQPFRVLLLRARQCRCGRPLGRCGHHRSSACCRLERQKTGSCCRWSLFTEAHNWRLTQRWSLS